MARNVRKFCTSRLKRSHMNIRVDVRSEDELVMESEAYKIQILERPSEPDDLSRTADEIHMD